MLSTETITDIASAFAKELTKSKAGKKSSIPFIKQTLYPSYTQTGTVQVIVIGGSTYRTAQSARRKQRIILSDKQEGKLPLFTNREVFLAFVASLLFPDTTFLAINFAFPLTPCIRDGKTDGILISGTKEHAFLGLVGKTVGKEIETYVQNILHKKIHVILANDAVCLLLSGYHQAPWQSLAAGIIGTGVNFAITGNGHTVVNLESGNFTLFPKSDTLAAVDKNSSSPGKALFEKETAGAYLYQHFNEIIKQKQYPFAPLKSTHELKQLALSPTKPGSQLARLLIERSAGLVSTQVAGIAFFTNQPMTFIMEGGFFWGEEIYHRLVLQYLAMLDLPNPVTLTHVADSSLLGAAILAMDID